MAEIEKIGISKETETCTLMIMDGLDEELHVADTISSILEELKAWKYGSLRLLVTSINDPPTTLQRLVQHVPIRFDRSARQLIKAHLRGTEYRRHECFATAVDELEKQSAKDLNYVPLFFKLAGVELSNPEDGPTTKEENKEAEEGGGKKETENEERGVEGLEKEKEEETKSKEEEARREKAGNVLARMLSSKPIDTVYEEHLMRCAVSMPGCRIVHDLLGVVAAFGGVAVPSCLRAVLQKPTIVDAALQDLQRAGLATVEEKPSFDTLFGNAEVFILLPGFLRFLRNSDRQGKRSYDIDYAALGLEILRQARPSLLNHEDDPNACAMTISLLLRGGQTNDMDAGNSDVDAELKKFAVNFADLATGTVEPAFVQRAASLCLVVHALAAAGSTELAATLWKMYVLGLITKEEINTTQSRVNGLIKFGVPHADYRLLAEIRGRLFDALRELPEDADDPTKHAYRSKLAQLPIGWARGQQEQIEEFEALRSLFQKRSYLADEISIAQLMKAANSIAQLMKRSKRLPWYKRTMDVYNSLYKDKMDNKEYVLSELATAHKGAGNFTAIRPILKQHSSLVLPYVLGPFLDALSQTGATKDATDDDLAFARTCVRSWRGQSTDLRLVSCLAQLLSMEGSNFANAEEEVEDLRTGVHPPVALDAHSVFHLLSCDGNAKEKAPLVQGLGVEEQKRIHKYREVFIGCLRDAGYEDEARQLEASRGGHRPCRGRGKHRPA